MKQILFFSFFLVGMGANAYAQYYNGPQPINPPIGGCVTGREGICPTNRLPIVCPGGPCPTNRLPRVKPDPTPVPMQGTSYSVF